MPKWQDVPIAAGDTESAEIAIDYDEIVVPRGRITDANGDKVKRADRPEFETVESGSGSKIVLEQPAAQDLVFKVKSVEDDSDDDEPGTPTQLPA